MRLPPVRPVSLLQGCRLVLMAELVAFLSLAYFSLTNPFTLAFTGAMLSIFLTLLPLTKEEPIEPLYTEYDYEALTNDCEPGVCRL